MRNQIIRFFPDTDLRNSHEGLRLIAKKNGIDVESLSPGEFLVFCNTARTQVKIYGAHWLICHLRSPKGRLDLQSLVYLPRTFNGAGFNYDEAVRQSLLERGFREVILRSNKLA